MSNPRTHHPAEGSLHALVDGELGAQHSAIEAHVAQCALCAEQVRRLELLRRTAAGLSRELAPPEALWESVAARIQREAVTMPTLPVGNSRRARHWLAAASVLCAVGLVGAYAGGRDVTPRSGGTVESVAAPGPGFAPTDPDFTARDPLADQLQRLLTSSSGSGVFPGSVANDVASNLREFDQALERTQAALATDPNNVQLEAMVARSRRHRAEFVSSTLALLTGY